MSFAAQLTLSPDMPTALTTNGVDYDLIQYNGKSAIRKVAGLDLDEPATLTISHEVVNGSGVRRHLVRLDSTKQDSVEPTIVGTMSMYFVIVAPPVISDAAVIEDLAAMLSNFLATSGNITKILNEEI